MSYVNHGLSLGVGDEQNGEGYDGGKNTCLPYDTLSGDVMGDGYILAVHNRRAREDEVSSVLPQVEDGNIPGRVTLPFDMDGTIRFNGGCLAAQDASR